VGDFLSLCLELRLRNEVPQFVPQDQLQCGSVLPWETYLEVSVTGM
jgi:hypothetical protein